MTTKRTMRLRMDLKLYNNGKLVCRASKRIKSRLRALLQENSGTEWTSGRLRVWYSVPNDYWNEGEFTTIAGFEELLTTFTEYQLVKEFTS